jgi:hypothetical protein
MQFQGDERGLSGVAVRLISAGGTIANLLAAFAAMWLLTRQRRAIGRAWFFLWLLATVNLLEATGYWFYAGLMNIGDWADVVRGLQPAWIPRVALTIVGAFTYWLTVKWAMRQFGERLQASGAARVAIAYRYTLIAYLTAGCLELVAGLREPGGAMVVLIAGVAASFGGMSGLIWGPQLLRNDRFATQRGSPLSVRRNWPIIFVAACLGALFVVVLGRGVALRS